MKNRIIIFLILVCSSVIGWAQSGSITGTVTDRWGKPVSGAQVYVNGNISQFVATNSNGEFSIVASAGDELTIKAADGGMKRVPAVGSPMAVIMDFASQAVDMGFGFEQTVAESTGAISRATNEQIEKRSALSLANSLYGNVLGLSAIQIPGTAWESGSGLTIRGFKTLTDNSIIVVVDGIERSIQNITPEEVESVSVLRDAAAVALYGYRGVNGVVSIKTKRGKYRTKEINISYDHAFNTQSRLPEFMNSYDYANAMNEALANDRMAPRYSQNELNAFKSGEYPYLYPNVNWVDEIFRDMGSSNIYSVNFRGGGSRMRYYTMLNLQDDRGFIKNAEMNEGYSTQMKYSKLNLRTNLDIDLTPTTKAEVNLLGILNEFSRPGLGSDAIYAKLYQVPSAAFPIKTEDGLWGGSETWGENMSPVALSQARGYSKGHIRTLFADFKLSQRLDFLTEGLGVSARLAYDNMANYWEGRNRGYEYGNDAVVSWIDGKPGELSRFKGGQTSNIGFNSYLDGQERHFNFLANLDYKKSFGASNLYTMLMYSFDNRVRVGQNTTFFRQNVSAYAHYTVKDRYIVDLSLSASASNKLAPGKKWGFSPTLSAAWVISNEDFMRGSGVVDFMKLRASAGIIHTDVIPVEDYWEQSFGGGLSFPLGGTYQSYGGTMEGSLPVFNSTREKAYKYNVGIDAAFLKGFVVTFDAYYESRRDIWVSAAGKNSAVLGVGSPYTNDGIMDSRGIEAGLNYDKKLGEVQLSLGGKFTIAKNKIVEQLEEPLPYDYLRRTGRPFLQLFGLQAVGYFIDDADIANSPAQQFGDVRSGDIKFKDQNGDNIINQYDNIAMGYSNTVPEIYFSFDIGFEWKGLGLNATFQGVGNYSAQLGTSGMFIPLIDNTNISEHYYANRWTPDTPFARYPRLTTQTNPNNLQFNSVWLADASFLKLRNCEFYYKLPASILSKIHMKSAKVYVRGVDLLCFDKIKVADPESVNNTFPMIKSVHLGISVGF